ncbi:MAG: glycosyltransferase family 25 protein [Pseudomonadota bacterium]
MALPVFVINRPQDAQRLAAFQASAASVGIQAQVIRAVDGHDPDFPAGRYADLIGPHFWGSDQAKPGALGCFLSHRLAWETILNQGLEAALICEDDAAFQGGVDLLNGADGADLVFANGRMAAWSQAVGGARDLPQVVAGLARFGGPKALGIKPSPGADCYLVTAAGAGRLLDWTARLRIICGVDWAMVLGALGPLPPGASDAFPELGLLEASAPENIEISAIILPASLADQAGTGGSTIRHSVTVPLSQLVARR